MGQLRRNYVFIDYESVCPEQLTGLDLDHFKVVLFVGAHQTRLHFDLAAAIQRLGTRAEYIKISGSGPNALDFHIAFYIGQIAAADPGAYFHIISKDRGFDPLIQHLKTKKIFVARAKDISEIPLVKVANLKSAEQRVEVVVAKLKQLKAGRPRTVKTLKSTINTLFHKQLSESAVTEVVEAMQTKGLVTITDKKLIYGLPADR